VTGFLQAGFFLRPSAFTERRPDNDQQNRKTEPHTCIINQADWEVTEAGIKLVSFALQNQNWVIEIWQTGLADRD